MADVDYGALVLKVEAILRADPRLADVSVDTEIDSPTAEQCPAVVPILDSADHNPRQLVSTVTAGAPDEVICTLSLHCWAFSAQGTADAARQRDTLVTAVVDVLRDNRGLGGVVQWSGVPRISFTRQSGANGIFAGAVVTLRTTTLA